MVLQYQLTYVQHTLHAASQRKERLEDLMSRKSAKKWDAQKKATMVRKLVTATQTIEQCVAAADELAKKLEGVVAKMKAAGVKQNNVAPFVKAPPTSVEEAFAEAKKAIEESAPALDSPFGE